MGKEVLRDGRVLLDRGLCMHVSISTVYMNAQEGRARGSGQFWGETVSVFVDLLFFFTLGRMTREGFNGRVRPEAL